MVAVVEDDSILVSALLRLWPSEDLSALVDDDGAGGGGGGEWLKLLVDDLYNQNKITTKSSCLIYQVHHISANRNSNKKSALL